MIAPGGLDPAGCLVLVTRVEVARCGRCVRYELAQYFVAVVELSPGEAPRLLDTRSGETWTGAFTPEEQAEADALLERAREMRRLDEQRWPVAA